MNQGEEKMSGKPPGLCGYCKHCPKNGGGCIKVVAAVLSRNLREALECRDFADVRRREGS